MKKKTLNIKEKVTNCIVKGKKLKVFVVMCAILLATNQQVYASTDDVVAPLINLKTMLMAIVAAIGGIILVKNIMEAAQAYQGQDSTTLHSAIKGIVAGLLMAMISTVLIILGV